MEVEDSGTTTTASGVSGVTGTEAGILARRGGVKRKMVQSDSGSAMDLNLAEEGSVSELVCALRWGWGGA